MRSEEREERIEVLIFRVSLSEQDFDKEGGASGREGFRRMRERREK